ncbi:MAG: DUF4080 domain-containing protein [Clostridia bacterium]|nr:DUF4080 domain-containing protein [Clostridia bacterium]
MKALICSINSKYIHSSLAPWCLAGGLEKYAPTVEYQVVEGTINERVEDVFERLPLAEYNLIGFCTYIWNISFVLKLCNLIKNKYKVKIVLGGPEVSYNANEILENQNIDYVLSGEGEFPFAQLCNGESKESIKGLCYRDGDKIIVSEPYVSFDEPPSPYVDKYFESLNGRISYIETSRGCPYRCAFCLSGRCGGVRFFDLEESKKRIERLANSGTKTVKFIDRTFNADRKRAREIFSFIIDNYGKKVPRGVCFHFEIEGELIDTETVELLKKAPCGSIQLEIGIQSFNNQTLAYINRKTNLEKLSDNIKALVNLGNIHIHIDLIAGLPYEDIDSFEESFNKAYHLNAHMLQFGFLKMLHGSDMRENNEKYKCEYSNNAPYEVISTPWLTAKEIEIMHTCEDIFDKMYNSSRFKRTCNYLVEALGNPFGMFMNFSTYLSKKQLPETLDQLTLEIYTYFSGFKQISKNELRDVLVMDRLSTNRMGTIPEFLKIHSPLTKQLLNELEKNEKTKKPKNTKRALSLLSDMDKYIYVDYTEPNPVTKEYELYQKSI